MRKQIKQIKTDKKLEAKIIVIDNASLSTHGYGRKLIEGPVPVEPFSYKE